MKMHLTLTSKSFITGTGLKKCRPANLSSRVEVDAMSAMEREEVLEAKIVCAGATCDTDKFAIISSYVSFSFFEEKKSSDH